MTFMNENDVGEDVDPEAVAAEAGKVWVVVCVRAREHGGAWQGALRRRVFMFSQRKLPP